MSNAKFIFSNISLSKQNQFQINLFILFLEELAVEASEQAPQEWYMGILGHHP